MCFICIRRDHQDSAKYKAEAKGKGKIRKKATAEGRYSASSQLAFGI
jgi:hypothetical protein